MNTNKARTRKPLVGEEARRCADRLLEAAVRKVIEGSPLPENMVFHGIQMFRSPYGQLFKGRDRYDDGELFYLESPVCKSRLVLKNRATRPESGVVATYAHLESEFPGGAKNETALPTLYVHVDTYRDDLNRFYDTVLSRPLAQYALTVSEEERQKVTFLDIYGNALDTTSGWFDAYDAESSHKTMSEASVQEVKKAILSCGKEVSLDLSRSGVDEGATVVGFTCGVGVLKVHAKVEVGTDDGGDGIPVRVSAWGQSGDKGCRFNDKVDSTCDPDEPLYRCIQRNIEVVFAKVEGRASQMVNGNGGW